MLSIRKKPIKVEKCNSIPFYLTSLTIFIVFLSIGAYWSILSMGIFVLILGVEKHVRVNWVTLALGAPYSIFLIYLVSVDFNTGALWKTPVDLPLSLVLSVLIIVLAPKVFGRLVQKATRNCCFIVCPNCLYMNDRTVNSCQKCNYNSSEKITRVNQFVVIDSTNSDIEKIFRNFVASNSDSDIFIDKMPTTDFFGYYNDEYIRFTHLAISSSAVALIESGYLSSDHWKKIYAIKKQDVKKVIWSKKSIAQGTRFSLDFYLVNENTYSILFKINKKNIRRVLSITNKLKPFCALHNGESIFANDTSE